MGLPEALTTRHFDTASVWKSNLLALSRNHANHSEVRTLLRRYDDSHLLTASEALNYRNAIMKLHRRLNTNKHL